MPRPLYNFLHRSILHNLGLKLVSLLLAVGLWLAVAGEPTSEVAIDVPIALVNLPDNLEISSENIPRAQVRLRGPERIVRHLQPSDIFADVELNAVKPGERSLELTVHRPRDLTIVQVVPSVVHLTFDLHATRAIPVKPRVTVPQGYEIVDMRVDPSTIEISGPKQRVDTVGAASTDLIDLSGATGQTSFSRHAYVSDPLVQVANSDPVKITVTMDKVSPGH